MHKGDTKRAFRLTILIFTVLYCLGMGLRVGYFLRAGKSMICEADALEQHINALIAYGKWFRGFLYTLRTEHRLSLQNYSFGIGLGGDFYTGMQYYGVGEPLNLPVFFLPSTAVYYYYQFLILLRPYLAGLSFLSLCFYRHRRAAGEEKLSVAGMTAGALLYSFSGTVLFIGMWNPFFVIPMITLPLLIRGTEILLTESRRVPLVFAVFLAGISNFYFFYMQVLQLIGWFILRRIDLRRDPDRQAPIPGALRTWLSFILSGTLGVFMGAVLLFPMFLALLNNPRSGGHEIPLLYESEYYIQLLRNLSQYIYHPLHDTELGLTVLAWPVLTGTLLFAGKWKLKRERTELLLLILMLCVPAAGYVMSGFAYAINRWCFAIALLTAWLTAVSWERWLSLLPVGKPRLRRIVSPAVLVITALSIGWNLYTSDAPEAGNLPTGFVDRVSGRDFLDRMTLTEVNALEQTVAPVPNRFVRYSGRNLVWNAALLHGVSSTQFYWSLTNGAVADLFSELAINDLSNFNYLGPEDRMIASELMGVTHYTLRYDTPEEQTYVPAGFVRAAEYYNFAIYENPIPIGLGTVYDRVLPRKAYLTLTPAEREESQLLAAILPDDDVRKAQERGISVTDITEMSLSTEHPSVTWLPTDDTVLRDDTAGSFTVTGENGGSADLIIDMSGLSTVPAAQETGLYFEGLSVDAPGDIINIGISARRLSDSPDDPTETISAVSPEDWTIRRTISYKTPDSEFYSGWHDYLVNLGSGDLPYLHLRISFPSPGNYTIKGLSAISHPIDPYLSGERETLSARSVQETDLHKNPVSLMTDTVTCYAAGPDNGPGLLLLTIPWQSGWRAFVDDVRTPLIRTNTAFTGLILPSGTHAITLRYRTPGLVPGIFFSIAGIAGFILICLREHRPDKAVPSDNNNTQTEEDQHAQAR